jgi:hypothetical protein
MLATSIMILIFNLIGIYLASKKWFRWIGIGLTLISVLFILESSVEWLSPNHFLIAINHIPTFLLCAYITIRSFYMHTKKQGLSTHSEA